jgi:predicted nucleic acid-binding protein
MINRVYDAGALMAADCGEPSFWHDHGKLVTGGLAPIVPAAVVAQVSRVRRRQANLARLLKDCEVVDLSEKTAHLVGALLAVSKTSDIVDASVVVAALEHDAKVVLTSDIGDIEHLVQVANAKVHVMLP